MLTEKTKQHTNTAEENRGEKNTTGIICMGRFIRAKVAILHEIGMECDWRLKVVSG